MRFSVITPTHDTRWLAQAYESLKAQTFTSWEWVVCVNDKKGRSSRLTEALTNVCKIVGTDPRVRIVADDRTHHGIGQRKKYAFSQAQGDILVELDHDDLLTPNALQKLDDAFANPDIGFAYSDFADFDDNAPRHDQGQVTYRKPDVRPDWISNGFEFYEEHLSGVRPGTYECVRAFPPTALSLSTIFWAPNHVRAWRRSVYESLGGHNEDFDICDDHELLCRTYLTTKMVHIPHPLYLYRVSQENTWTNNVDKIKKTTWELHEKYFEKLILRQCFLEGTKAYDLGGRYGTPVHTEGGLAPWTPVDISDDVVARGGVSMDLRDEWWGKIGHATIGAFRAYDLLEHLPVKLNTMRNIWIQLKPGGYLLSQTPSTDGRGAFMDPTHVSYWNEPAFWYWTRRAQMGYMPDSEKPRVTFQEVKLDTYFPSPWHTQYNIPYVRANLVALKDGYKGPGEKLV